MDFVYGGHAVLELLLAKRRKVLAIYMTNNGVKLWDQIKKLLPSYVTIHTVSRETLTKMANSCDHQGIIAYVGPFVYQKALFDPGKSPFVLVLDGIQDVRNMGAILRSAYCTGVDGVVLSYKGCAPINAAAIKASAGLAEHVQIYLAATTAQAVSALQASGYQVYLATLGKGENAANIKFQAPSALVIGSEEMGISAAVLKKGTRILLPQRRADISYNASVAAGILLFLMGTHMQKIS